MESEFILDDQIDKICDRFETAWRLGQDPEVIEFWEPLAGDTDDRLFQELICLDVDYRSKAGKKFSVEIYLQKFPEYEQKIRRILGTTGGSESPTKTGLDPWDTWTGDDHEGELATQVPKGSALKRVGPYQLLRKIGSGGMGMVYLAEQREPVRRTVAIKLMRTELDTPELLARFEVEIQALSMMNHPNIARVLDMGKTEQGTPYVAIEYVDGFSLTKYCDHRQLSIVERLGLFKQLCAAICHAHRKGVLHRDLKPSNILVSESSGKPMVKVIDFGLARAVDPLGRLAENTLVTMPGNALGTIEYMSPEQAEMNEQGLDTRTDVYSLGVILYELLTGTTPLNRERVRNEGLHRLMIQVVEGEFQRPSDRLLEQGERATQVATDRQTRPQRLYGMLRKELDWVCARALQKKRSQRYEGVAFLLKDVQSYLNGDVVTARPPTVSYQLGKTVWKHRAAFAVSVLLLIILIGGWWTTGVSLEKSRQQERKSRAAEAFSQRMENVARKEARSAQQAEQVALEREAKAKQNLLVAEKNNYVADMLVIQSDWENGKYLNRLSRVMDNYRARPDLAGFEWNYWNRQTNRWTEHVLNPGPFPKSIDFSPDGRQLVSLASGDGIRIWDVESGAELGRIQPPGDILFGEAVQFSPDGRSLLYTSRESAWVLEMPSGKIMVELSGNNQPFYEATFSTDQKEIITASRDLTLDFWDATTGEKRRSAEGMLPSRKYGFSKYYNDAVRDAVKANLADNLRLRFWDIDKESWNSIPLTEDDIHFSYPKNKILASDAGYYVADDVKGIKQFDRTGEARWFRLPAGFGPGMTNWSIDPNGKYMAAGNVAGMISLWHGDRPNDPILIRESTGSIEFLEFSPDSKRLVAFDSSGDLRIIDLAAQTYPQKINSTDVLKCNLSSNRGLAVFCGNSKIEVFTPGQNKQIASFDYAGSTVDSVAITNRGDHVVVSQGDGTVRMLQGDSGQQIWSWKGSQRNVRSAGVSLDGSGERVLIANGKRIVVLDAKTGAELHSWQAHETIITGLAFHPDGKRVASGCYGGNFKYWEVSSRQQIWSRAGKAGISNRLAFSQDGRVLATCFGGVHVLATETGKLICELDTQARDVTVNQDGSRVATVEDNLHFGQGIRIWTGDSGQELLTLKSPNRGVPWWIGFGPDDRWFLAQTGNSLTLWEVLAEAAVSRKSR